MKKFVIATMLCIGMGAGSSAMAANVSVVRENTLPSDRSNGKTEYFIQCDDYSFGTIKVHSDGYMHISRGDGTSFNDNIRNTSISATARRICE